MSWATGSNPGSNPYTVNDAVYSLGKCVEWMQHFQGYNIGIVGQILGTKYIVRVKENPEMVCRGLDPRTHDHLAENKMKKLVREKLLSEIRKLRGMPDDEPFADDPANETNAENKAIYDMRDQVEKESSYVKWIIETLARAKNEEETFFKENPPWFLTWIEEILNTATFTELCGVMSCANYLDIKPLVRLSRAAIISIMRHKTNTQWRAEVERMNNRRVKNG